MNRTSVWWLTPHAARAMVKREFTRAEVLEAAEQPEVSYDSGPDYPRSSFRQTRQRGRVAVVVDTERMEIITVLHRITERWEDQP